MIQCRKEAPGMTALATRFTRCHLIQLHCWAKINSVMMTSALFNFIIYIFTLAAFVPPSRFLCIPHSFNGFIKFQTLFSNVAAIRIPQICRKISLFHLCNYWHKGRRRGAFQPFTHAHYWFLWGMQKPALSTGLPRSHNVIYDHLDCLHHVK